MTLFSTAGRVYTGFQLYCFRDHSSHLYVPWWWRHPYDNAAREFLCLQDEDHAHEREMAVVIKEISRTSGVDGAPDWRVKNVRSEIRDAVLRHDKDWRPLAESEGDLDYNYWVAAARREPSFDVEAFMKDHQAALHTIPRADDKSRLWTCDPKAWRRAQTAACHDSARPGVLEDPGQGPSPQEHPNRCPGNGREGREERRPHRQ